MFALGMRVMVEQRRFSGMDRLYGLGSVERLQASHVCVVGVGGVGSWAVEALARCGVGRITLIDADHVVESNVNRQVQAVSGVFGQAKISALCDRIGLIHPSCVVTQVDAFIDEDALDLIPEDADVVLDCVDQVRAKLAMLNHCKQRRQALLMCGAAGGKVDASRIVQADLAFAVQDPILAKVRQKWRTQLRDARVARMDSMNAAQCSGPTAQPQSKSKSKSKSMKLNVPVLFSDEAIRYPAVEQDVCASSSVALSGHGATAPQGLNCAGFGSSVMVTASFGMAAAQWAIAQLMRE